VIREAICFVSVCFYFSILVFPEAGLFLEKNGSGGGIKKPDPFKM
jgi:hypothetical protein